MSDKAPSSKTRRKRQRHGNRRRIVVAAGILLAAGIGVYVAFEGRFNAESVMADATRQFEAGDYDSALVNLRDVVSRERDNAAARFLLGRTYLAAGDPAGAIKELRRARELGETSRALNLGLTRAIIATGQYDDAATEIAIYGDTSEADWLVLRGMLDLGQQRLEDARSTFRKVLEQDEHNEQAHRGLMQAELAAGNAGLARREVETLLKTQSGDIGLWLIKGELDLHDGNAEHARDAFRKALDIAPKNPPALIGMARALIALGVLDRAANHLDALPVEAADTPRVNFLRALIAEDRGDESSALLYLRKVLHLAPMHRESLVAAARLHFGTGEYSLAREYVARLLELEPGNAAARRMMAAIQLAAGRIEGFSGLGDATEPDPDVAQDPGMLALLGTAYLKHGRVDDSQESLERAAALAPDSLPIRTQLALSRLSNGRAAEAQAELEAILAESPDYLQAEIMLALVYLSQKEMAKAREQAEAIVSRHKDSALAHNVLGYTLEVSGDAAGAMLSFRNALTRDPAFHPARINLARLAVQGGKRDEAAGHLNDVLKSEPHHSFALMGLAALALQADDLDEAEKLWQRARENNPDAIGPRLLLAKHYRAKRSIAAAEKAIGEAYAIAPYAPQVQAEYAAVMMQAGKFSEALEAAKALTARAPKSTLGLELLAQAYNHLGDAEGLRDTLERIAEIAPDAVGAQLLLGRLAIRRKDYDAANAIVAALLVREDAASYGHELQGDIEVAQDRLERAADAYQRAYAAKPESANVIKLDQMERRLGRPGNRLAEWLLEHPDDLQVRLVHASYLQEQGAGADAIAHYEQMNEQQSDNPVVLNNLAWLYHEAGDERASALAKRAYELAPKQAEIVDTYGWILLQRGKLEQGLDLLKKAQVLAPSNPDIAFHVASALSASGHTAEARKKLESVLSGYPEFPTRKQAESLLAKLASE